MWKKIVLASLIFFIFILTVLPFNLISETLPVYSFRFPLDGAWNISQEFGEWNQSWNNNLGAYHLAEDVPRAAGTPVYAAANGYVRFSGEASGYGHLVVIEHRLPDGTFVCSLYGHLKKDGLFEENKDVKKGEVIGYIGDINENGGYGPHLHFGIRKGIAPEGWVWYGYEPPGLREDWLDPSDFILKHTGSDRIYGDSRYETAVEMSRKGWSQAEKVILARGDAFPDALAGSSLSARYDAPILLTYQNKLNGEAKNEIIRLGAKEVFILGSEEAFSNQVTSDLINQCKIDKTKIFRIGGEDRYQTASLIAQYGKITPSVRGWSISPSIGSEAATELATAFVVTGENYPDALAVSYISAFKGFPILLVDMNNIYPSTQEALKNLAIKKVVIIGGADIIPDSIANWFTTHGYSAERIAGEDRYETARKIAEWAINAQNNENYIGLNTSIIFIATGENFPDGLVSGPVAAKNRALLLLVRPDFIPQTISSFMYEHRSEICQLNFCGGADVINENIKNSLSSIIFY